MSGHNLESEPRLQEHEDCNAFFFLVPRMLVVNPFWWKAYVPLPFADLYSVDDLMVCISVSHALA